jgi:hypothetical protein
MSQSRTEGPDRPQDAPAPYEPPALVVLGAVDQFTAGSTSGPDTMAVGSVTVSDRALKEDVRPVDVRAVLEAALDMPVSGWRYRGDDPSVRHIGPMAQDFAAAFRVGSDDRHIEMVDAFGAAIACIQALHAQLGERDAQIDALWTELRELQARLDGRQPSLVAAD